jgi:hypothetical protein
MSTTHSSERMSMEFFDFQLRAWAADNEQVAAFVHSSPAGAMQRPQMTRVDWESFGRFRSLLQSEIAQVDSAKLEAGGQELARTLFPDQVTALLMESLRGVGPDDGLRVRLCLDVTLSDLPWEYLFLPSVGGFMALDARLSIVREPPRPGPSKPIPRKKRRLLYYGVRNCNANGLDLWQIAEERDKLLKAVEPASALLETLAVVSNESDCKTALLKSRGPIDIFHYSGHTDVENGMGYLIAQEIHQPSAPLVRLDADALGALLRRAGTSLAVFSACNSGNWAFVEPLLRAEIPVVIAARGLLEVRVAVRFCEQLYYALAIGLSLDEAVSWARLHLLEPGLLPDFLRWQWGTFIVYMRTPEAVLFPRPRKPEVAHEQSAARKARHLTIANVIKDGTMSRSGDWPAVDQNGRRSTLFVETILQKRDGTNRTVIRGTAFVSKVIRGGAQALTAAHVVPAPANDETAEYKVALGSKQAPLVGVQVVKRNPDVDIALLLLPATSAWISLPIGESSDVPEGSPLYTLGFPLDSELAGAPGILSSIHGPKGIWQTTFPLEHGNSGGPVLDAEGKVVAVASGGIDDARAITYAIPIDYVGM